MLLLLTLLTFSALYLIGDPVDLLADPRASSQDLQILRQSLGLDGGPLTQYAHFLSSLLTGTGLHSFIYHEAPLNLIFEKLPATFELILPGLFFALLCGVPLGIYIGSPPPSPLKQLLRLCTLIGFSVPSYITGLLLVWAFSIHWGVFPSFGRGEAISFLGIKTSILTLDGLWHLALPVLTLFIFKTSFIARTVSSSTRRILASEPVHFAKARGLKQIRINLSFVLRGLLATLLTLTILEFGGLLAYSVMIEMVFAWPGIGKLLIDSILTLDRPVVLTYVLFVASFYLVLNTIAEILHTLIDPRLSEPARHA